jgi:UDPglucose 6-dehydrogenase
VKIVMIGTGYVGLVTGTCFASGMTSPASTSIRRRSTRSAKARFRSTSPASPKLVQRNSKVGRLNFTTSYPEAVPGADAVFIAVGTPQDDDGSADLRGLWAVTDSLAPHLSANTVVVVVKSTFRPDESQSGRAAQVAAQPRCRCRFESRVPQGRGGDSGLHRSGPGRRRRIAAGSQRKLHELTLFLRTEHPYLVMGLKALR